MLVVFSVILNLVLVGNGLAAPGKSQMPPVFVETITANYVAGLHNIYAVGTLKSIPGTVIHPEISGRITKVYFTSGKMVQQGEKLLEINPAIIKSQLLAASAQLKLSKLSFSRAQALYRNRDISKSDFDQAQANYSSDLAKVDGLQAQLAQTTIVAPFSGKLGLSLVGVGDYISPEIGVVSLQTVDPLKVDFSVPERYQRQVIINQEVSLTSDAYPGKVFKGRVEAVDSLVDLNTRTLNVRANVPNSEALLIPGGFVNVNLNFDQKKIISIPQTAVVYEADGVYIYKLINNEAQKTKVELGMKDQDNVEIKAGLKVGEVVVVTGQMKLYPGAKIVVVNSGKPSR